MSEGLHIVDCTLRDGGYAVDYAFTAETTANVCRALEECGVDLIEVGHGVGLGGSTPEYGIAAATDEEYIRAAGETLTRAKFGTFFIPGIGTKAHLDMAREHGMGFVRIGANVTQVEKTREYIDYSKKLGFLVSYNAMKSYLLTPREFFIQIARTVEWGVDIVYLVDSAGTMLPADVAQYIGIIKDKLDVPVGFHGHNNLMLAVANSIAAMDAGASYIDSTMQGIGRSGGNAQTEILVAVCKRKGRETGIDMLRIMDAGERWIKPFMAGGGMSGLNVCIGLAGFHSSFLDRIERSCLKYGVDERLLIIRVCEQDREDPSERLIEETALLLAGESAQSRRGDGSQALRGGLASTVGPPAYFQ